MTETNFRERIRASLANRTLQIALDANAERRVLGRVAAFASLPDWSQRRQQAHAIRAEVIEHLEEHIELFIQKAEHNGIMVHRARDAEEAIKIILEIVRDSPQRARGTQRGEEKTLVSLSALGSQEILIAKSKSMVSEEINLNHALEARGMRVVETDLGEYIVQLRNEKPAHIITPAVHLRREDVGRLFHEKLGIPYTEDIPTLTQTARQVLREVFLTADVGISGVNFGVAETGTICLVTNEGNGRMVTTLPPVHIALMGMERLVRNLDDLALMLSLLPRSATTQKLSVYTQLIHSPLPGQERHLVILDNGRTGLRNSPLRESLYCIRCGACLNACPVFREIGGHGYGSVYPGPIGSVISAGFFGPEFIPLAQASSLCGACKEACPVDIDLPKLLTRVRAGLTPAHRNPSSATSSGLSTMGTLFMRVYSRVARSPRLFSAAQKVAALGTRLVSRSSGYVRMPAFTGWGYSKDLPKFASRSFRQGFTERNVGQDLVAPIVKDTRTHEAEAQERASSEVTRVTQFIEELQKVSGHVVHTDTRNVTRDIGKFLKARGVQHIHLEPVTLDENALQRAGITVRHARDAGLRVGVTKAVCGLADTGSILVADAEGDPLIASLLPEIHIAVLYSSRILPSLADAFRLPVVTGSGAAVVITGPSRTADIEMSLTIGMHGPRELHVFLVHGAASTLVHGTASTLVDD